MDERLAAYGFETNTGVRFVCVIDVAGREVRSGLSAGGAGGGGLREGELKVVCPILSYLVLFFGLYLRPVNYNVSQSERLESRKKV